MKKLLTLSAAASVLAIGMSAYHAAALSPGANSVGPDGLVLKVQKSDEKGPGASGGGGKSGDSGARSQDGGGKGAAPGATQDKGDRGSQMRSGDKGARGEGARSQQRTNVDVDVRGRRGDRARADGRTRVGVDVDRRHRTRGRDVDVGVGGYGYSSRVSAKTFCVATSNASPGDALCSGAPQGRRFISLTNRLARRDRAGSLAAGEDERWMRRRFALLHGPPDIDARPATAG
jgi:hypothetical protein